MKKILAIIPILTVLLFVSCDCGCNPNNIVNSGGEVVDQEVMDSALIYTADILVRTDVSKDGDVNNIRQIKRFKFDGHDYIQFVVYGSNSYKAGIIHDPECLKRDLGELVIEKID